MHRSPVPGTGDRWALHAALPGTCAGEPERPGDKGILKGDLEGVLPGQSDPAGGQSRGIPAGEERDQGSTKGGGMRGALEGRQSMSASLRWQKWGIWGCSYFRV